MRAVMESSESLSAQVKSMETKLESLPDAELLLDQIQ
jgi:hypothetical protein